MKRLYLLLIVCDFASQAQDTQLLKKEKVIFCFDARVGIGQYKYFAQTFNDEHANIGTHGATAYPQITANSGKGATPYISLGCGIRLGKGFEYLIGFAYRSYSYHLDYYNKEEYNFSVPGVYNRTVSQYNSPILNHVLRFEFAPTFRIRNTKLSFGFLNLDYITHIKKTLNVRSTEYIIIPKHNSIKDSIVIENGSTNLKKVGIINDKIYFSWSFGIEQEIPIKNCRYLIGIKSIYARTTLSFIAYLGIRISKPYMWKNSIRD